MNSFNITLSALVDPANRRLLGRYRFVWCLRKLRLLWLEPSRLLGTRERLDRPSKIGHTPVKRVSSTVLREFKLLWPTMALSAMSPVAQAYMTHTPPSAHNPRPTKRNTVHWDKLELDLDQDIKENANPVFRINSPPLQKSGSLGAANLSQDALVDFGDRKFRGQHRRSQIAAETFVAPEALERSGVEPDIGWSIRAFIGPHLTLTSAALLDLFGDHSLVKAARQLNDSDNVFKKQQEKQFEWVLSLSAADVDRSLESASNLVASHPRGGNDRRYFGCNLLDWSKPAGSQNRLPGQPGDKYILLATPIDLQAGQPATTNGSFSTHQFQVIQDQTRNNDMAVSQITNTPPGIASSAYRPSPLSATSTQWSTAAEASEDSDNTLTFDPRRGTKGPLSTVEDSIEELDQFEDDIDAITTAASQLGLANSQTKSARDPKEYQPSSPNKGARQSSSAISTPQRQYVPMRIQRPGSLRMSSEDAPKSLAASDEDAGQKQPTATLRKVARPASLAPPKPIQKATKQPTISTFELPGERVARELKEKKAARLSMQFDPQKAAEANSPQRTRSVRSKKPPTVANFELPGERYSRQKKERFEQKLKEEEEEVRRRRQFKARPSPATVAPTVRSTFTSRQRQTTGQPEQGSPYSPTAEPSPKSGASKRQSVTMTPSTARTVSVSTASTASATARGRATSTGSTQASTRATSSSVGSVTSSRKHSNVSTEDIQQQKVRGRQIYNRDNSTGRSKEQEKRDREEAIKLARQKYAQMSRNLAATSRARRSQQQSSSVQHEATASSPKAIAPQVPKHREAHVDRDF